jgi:excisionase family DNA binding protein
VTDDDVVKTVRALARVEPDARIASILNRNRKPTAHGQTWTARRVCSLRHHHNIEVYREGERQSRGEVSVSETANILRVTQTTILRMIRLKRLPATQVCPNAPWILRRVDVEQCLAERNESTTPPTESSAQMSLEIP